MKNFVSLLITTAAARAMAHDGHGLSGSHWHSSDAWGFVVFGAVALTAWLIGRGK